MIFLSLQIRQNEIRAPSYFGRRLIIYNHKRDASPNYVLERVKTCICLRFITISYIEHEVNARKLLSKLIPFPTPWD